MNAVVEILIPVPRYTMWFFPGIIESYLSHLINDKHAIIITKFTSGLFYLG